MGYCSPAPLPLGLRSTAYIMNTNPSRQTTGATLMRLTLKNVRLKGRRGRRGTGHQKKTNDNHRHSDAKQDKIGLIKSEFLFTHLYIYNLTIYNLQSNVPCQQYFLSMHFKASNIIQRACLHPQIFVDGKQSAQPRNKYTEHPARHPTPAPSPRA